MSNKPPDINLPTFIMPFFRAIWAAFLEHLDQEFRPDLSKGTGTVPVGSGGTGSGSGALTTEQIQDMISTFIVAGSGITLTYDDAGNLLTIASTGGTVPPPYTYLVDSSGDYLVDSDGAYLYEVG